jgi:hypothetical protein
MSEPAPPESCEAGFELAGDVSLAGGEQILVPTSRSDYNRLCDSSA